MAPEDPSTAEALPPYRDEEVLDEHVFIHKIGRFGGGKSYRLGLVDARHARLIVINEAHPSLGLGIAQPSGLFGEADALLVSGPSPEAKPVIDVSARLRKATESLLFDASRNIITRAQGGPASVYISAAHDDPALQASAFGAGPQYGIEDPYGVSHSSERRAEDNQEVDPNGSSYRGAALSRFHRYAWFFLVCLGLAWGFVTGLSFSLPNFPVAPEGAVFIAGSLVVIALTLHQAGRHR